MLRFLLTVCIAAVLWTGTAGALEGDPKRGAQTYRACVACHALEPGLHLTGPSLGNLWNRKAGTAAGYARYSSGLKEADFEWNATALDGWLKDPQAMFPDTYMTFRGISDAQARADLIAFLELAGGRGGGAKAVADGLIPEDWIRGAAPEALRDPPQGARIVSLRHCHDSYFISTADGRETPLWEKNVRLKIDSVETGPPPGVPVLLRAGMGGDRFFVVFSSVADLTSLLKERC